MGLNVKDAASSAKKFVANASAAAPAYATGVQSAGARWQANTAAAEQSYGVGVQAAIAANRFSMGVNKAGASKYQTNASGKGAQRYPQGVAAAGPSWQAGVQPYLTLLSNLNLPAPGPKGSPQNMSRSAAVATALRAAKLGS
jgi:hypothetical protein